MRLRKQEIQAVRKEQTYNLHSRTVQAIADKYVANRETIRQLRLVEQRARDIRGGKKSIIVSL